MGLDHLFFDDLQLIRHRSENVQARGNQSQQIDQPTKTNQDQTQRGQDQQGNVKCTDLESDERRSLSLFLYFQGGNENHHQENHFERV